MQIGESISKSDGSPLRILSLDGGGAKGFYTLGILDELEKNARRPLHECFDIIFGTSTGSIIAALIARGDSVEQISSLYRAHVPTIMHRERPCRRTSALVALTTEIFGDTKISDLKTHLSIVATNWKEERPFIFKTSREQAHSSPGSFVPFFGCSLGDAVIASCSAYPFFELRSLDTSKGKMLLADGGFCANNPTLYAIADGIKAVNGDETKLKVVSLGVGIYPEPSIFKKAKRILGGWALIKHATSSGFLQKILGTNTRSMEQLREVLFGNVPTIRICGSYPEPEMATDLLEHDLDKLDRLVQKGRLSYEEHEAQLKTFVDYR